MPTDVDIERVQAEIGERQDRAEREKRAAPPTRDLRDRMRELMAYENWRQARLRVD